MGLLEPWLLWCGALALPLVLLYVLKARRQVRPVPALLLWQAVLRDLEARVPFRRLRRDWLLLLELLILSLLVLAAAGPFKRVLLAPGATNAIVLDASARMLVSDHFTQARQAAQDLIQGMGPGDRVVLVRAGARPQVLAPLSGERAALLAALQGVEAGAAPADLVEAIKLARITAGAGGKVVLVSSVGRVVADPEVHVIRVGETHGNVGIVALGVRPADSSRRNHEVFVRLRNASSQIQVGVLRLTVDGRLLDAARLHIEAQSEKSQDLDVLGVVEGVIEVAWRGEPSDAFPVDDRVSWVLRPPEERRYGLVGTVGPYLRRALATHTDWRLATTGEAPDVEIVAHLEPQPAGAPFLWVNPVAAREEEVSGGAVLSWDRTHPALRFVELRSVRLGRIPRLRRLPGTRVLAESTAGPLILEGRAGQRRFLLWAFDPVESDLPLRAAFPLLVKNCLEHLAPEDHSLPGGVATGRARTLPWPSDESVALVSPSGGELTLPVLGGLLRLPPLEETGIWSLQGSGEELRFATSLLDPQESDLGAGATDLAGEPVAPARRQRLVEAGRPAPRGLWRPLALLALILLLVEGAAFHRTSRPAKRRQP